MTGADHPGDFGLLMPFVVCESQGGPFDDAAFVAGYVSADIGKGLEALARTFDNSAGSATLEQYVDTRLLPQLDLIAMQHGFVMTHEPWDECPDEWALVTFTRTDEPEDGGS